MRGENDNPDLDAGGTFVPSTFAVFLPTIIILSGYLAALVGLWLAGRGDGALARLCLLVLVLGGPILVAHALLRRFTARIAVLPLTVTVHAGFPRSEPFTVPYALIRRVTVAHGPVGRLTGSGTLIFEVAGAGRIVVPDIARPSEALAAIGRLIDALAQETRPPRDRQPVDPRAISTR
jgi:membrane protein YdbS with pleckstrin-like domain